MVAQRRIFSDEAEVEILAVLGSSNLLFLLAGKRAVVAEGGILAGEACLKISFGSVLAKC